LCRVDCEPAGGRGAADAPVSFGSEELILVDSNDSVVGYRSKLDAHAGVGTSHRAFSAFLFDDLGRLLLHRRSLKKPLWPGFWTNSCCSHPRKGEAIEAAVKRRIAEELGVIADASYIYKFEYQAHYNDVGSEHELCSVYLAKTSTPSAISAHMDEVMEWCWLELSEVDRWVAENTKELTPWFCQEWRTLRSVYRDDLEGFIGEGELPTHPY